MLQSPCGCPFRAVIILTLSVFSYVKLFRECWVYSNTHQLRKVSAGQLKYLCVLITLSTNMTHRAGNSGGAKIVVSCSGPNVCPFMMRAHLMRLNSNWPFAHFSKQDVQSEGEELCFLINLAGTAIAFWLKFPRDSVHFISIRHVPLLLRILNKQSNCQEVKMNPHQIYPLIRNWDVNA